MPPRELRKSVRMSVAAISSAFPLRWRSLLRNPAVSISRWAMVEVKRSSNMHISICGNSFLSRATNGRIYVMLS